MKTALKKVNWKQFFTLLVFAVALYFPAVVLAQEASAAQGQICGVMKTVHSILKVASVLIVTIAIIFAGYQIAFAHKRISDVAPILIGGLLIGAASQLAVMVIGNQDYSAECTGAATESAFVIETLASKLV